jgi:hypothetical protein
MTCIPQELIDAAKAASGLEERQFQLMMVGLLRRWNATVNPGLDTSPNALMQRAAPFSGATTKQMDMVIVQLLCNMRG